MAASWSAIVNIATPMFETVVGDCIGLVMSERLAHNEDLIVNFQGFPRAVDEAVEAGQSRCWAVRLADAFSPGWRRSTRRHTSTNPFDPARGRQVGYRIGDKGIV